MIGWSVWSRVCTIGRSGRTVTKGERVEGREHGGTRLEDLHPAAGRASIGGSLATNKGANGILFCDI